MKEHTEKTLNRDGSDCLCEPAPIPFRISCEDLKESAPELYVWLGMIQRWVGRRGLLILKQEQEGFRIVIYTSEHIYSISAEPGKYLGCGASSRKPRPGEDWTRGNDLSDGKYSYETWIKILADIVAYELVPLHL